MNPGQLSNSAATNSHAPPQEELFRAAKILAVDDNEANLRYLERILRQAGLQYITTAPDSREVLPLFNAIDPDLIVLDLMMPYMNGYEVMEQLRPLVPQTSYLPILVITADITPEAKRRALAAGARDFLTKPFDPIEVVLRMKNLLQIRFLYRQLQNRIGRDIHDGPLQDLGVLLLRIEHVQREIEAGERAEALAGLRQLRGEIQATMRMLRGVVHDLRPPILETLGLDGALDFLASRLRAEASMEVALESYVDTRLDAVLEAVVFRLVQEALNNIRQHARARHAWLSLERQADVLHVTLRDDGQGFFVEERMREALATGHAGLAGMRERARSIGGYLTIESAPGEGTTIRMVFPFRAAEVPPAAGSRP